MQHALRRSFILAASLFSTAVWAAYLTPGQVLDNANSLNGQKVNVKPFTATGESKSEITCRAVGPVKTPDERPFEEYIRKALIDELQVSELYSESGPITLTGNLDQIDFSSTSGTWVMSLTLKSSNGRSLTVANNYEYETSFVGEKACALSAQAFGPAVQVLIGKIVYHPDFGPLLR